MPNARIEKTVEPAAVTGQQLEAINRLTRRALEADEVFVFSIVLCDNEIDRDFERFPTESLEALGTLFQGKTGVFDHSARAEHQSARIFETALCREDYANSLGEPYCCLRAWAYMARCDKNADLILEIDAGIKKEVSVGCAVEGILCSVCGQDQRSGSCEHEKGEYYGEELCHHLLVGPTDAYEWSFVAVPAQKNAGVTKKHSGDGLELSEQPVTLTRKQARELGQRIRRLEKLAGEGKAYREGLERDVVRLGLLAQPELSAETLGQMAKGLETGRLLDLQKSYRRLAGEQYPLQTQLGQRREPEQTPDDSPFRI